MKTNRSAMQHASASRGRRPASLLLLVTLMALACGEALAQDAQQQQQREDGPPPMRYLPDEVRRRLDAERDPKARARLGMEIAEERLARAAQLADQDSFVAATGEVGVYEAVVEDTVSFLYSTGRAGKMRDVLKRVEITLRSHVTRLETIRRSLPEHHAVYLKGAIEFVRDNRDRALGAFYSDAIIAEPRRPAVTTPAAERATTSGPARPEEDKKPQQR